MIELYYNNIKYLSVLHSVVEVEGMMRTREAEAAANNVGTTRYYEHLSTKYRGRAVDVIIDDNGDTETILRELMARMDIPNSVKTSSKDESDLVERVLGDSERKVQFQMA